MQRATPSSAPLRPPAEPTPAPAGSEHRPVPLALALARGTLSPGDVLRLQRTVGNRATGRLLAGLAARQAPAPTVQRDIAAANDFENGTLSIDMKPSTREAFADAYGEEGMITFEPANDGEKADSIELVQTVKVTQAAADVQWGGDEGIREAWKGADGRFVDALGGERRAAWERGGPQSDAYNADLAAGHEAAYAGRRFNAANGARRQLDVQPGYHRANGQRKKTELWDHPSSPDPGTYSFETSVVATGGAAPAERTWGSVRWGFRTVQTPRDGAPPDWSVAGEIATFHAAASGSHTAARQRFGEVMGNTGPLAPANIAAAKAKFSDAATREAGRADIAAIKARADVFLATLPAGADLWSGRLQALKTRLDDFMERTVAEEAEWAAAAVASAAPKPPPPPPPSGSGSGSAQQDNVPESWEELAS